ncbi:MAG: hypothetical protein D6681_19320 [Calditrichaeota bacterium]|nr:MAG: hypothetical protein D6681_19320 [Calditrichota bacterium]
MRSNPLKDFMDDELFDTLMEKGFLNERAVRDYYIRQKFNAQKDRLKPKQIIESLQKEFPYLSAETIRKIVYSKETELDPSPYYIECHK